MGKKFHKWVGRSDVDPQDFDQLRLIINQNRQFEDVETLDYGDYGLLPAVQVVAKAIEGQKRIALYADYDVDGTMSCVSWIWFLQAIGYHNFIHYIPDRFKEGYGVNLKAIQYLAEVERAELIITMDTGITANIEAAWCKDRGIDFICTDHHVIQPQKMPDCIILNPKLHPNPNYQELCGCGITFVLLRKLAAKFPILPQVWSDLLALVGMATICDVVPLNGVNHRLVNFGVQGLLKSRRPVLKKLLEACSVMDKVDEKDVGFRLGPRINAVGRLNHADKVVDAFVRENPDELIQYMHRCNEERKSIQAAIVADARQLALESLDSPILFLGGDWHPGVVGIAASKLAEEFWRPVWLYQKKDGQAKGSARSIPGFDVTKAMTVASSLFTKFGGHSAAAGFSFDMKDEARIRDMIASYAVAMKSKLPDLWESSVEFDCSLHLNMARLELCDVLDELKPFGHGYDEPRFHISAKISDVRFYQDKMTGEPKHTAVEVKGANGKSQKIMFFNEVHEELLDAKEASFLVNISRNQWQGRVSTSMTAVDFTVLS